MITVQLGDLLIQALAALNTEQRGHGAVSACLYRALHHTVRNRLGDYAISIPGTRVALVVLLTHAVLDVSQPDVTTHLIQAMRRAMGYDLSDLAVALDPDRRGLDLNFIRKPCSCKEEQ